MVERNNKVISSKIDNEIKKFGVLETSFKNISENETSLNKVRSTSFESISKLEEDNEYLRKVYTIFHSTMKDVENLRTNQIKKMNEVIIPATIYYPKKARNFKSKLSVIDLSKTNKEKQEKQLNTARNKNETDKVGKINAEIANINQKIGNDNTTFEKDFTDFEHERVTDNKYLLLHYIHSEIGFHATALEKLTRLYSEIMCYDPREGLPKFVEDMGLNTQKDNLANNYGFTPGETNRKLERLKNPNAGGMIKSSVQLNPVVPQSQNRNIMRSNDPVLEGTSLNMNNKIPNSPTGVKSSDFKK